MSESSDPKGWGDAAQEQSSAEHLRANPAMEQSLWREWVGVVCGWQMIPGPGPEEWVVLEAGWCHDKAPIDSVAELKRLRLEQPVVNPGWA